VQPICPGEGYIWTPGYWAWDGDDYYWVPIIHNTYNTRIENVSENRVSYNGGNGGIFQREIMSITDNTQKYLRYLELTARRTNNIAFTIPRGRRWWQSKSY
jgi:hypothetical protein